ncbi:MAG TPA: AI-2E family transporter [Anaerolineales bacterium]|nr:AI-2E family transporter [Anaerolineales bacterium]
MMQVFRYATIVVITLAGLLLIWQFSVAIVLFLLSLAVAAALRPMINSLMGSRVSKRLALAVVYSILVVLIVGTFFLVGARILDELQTASDDLLASYDRAKTQWPVRGTLFQQTLAEQLPPSANLYEALISGEGVPALQGVLGIAQDFFSILGNIAIVLILSLYWSADQLRFERLGLSLLPSEYHSRALHTWRSIEAGVGAYLRSEFVQSALAGLLLWAIYLTLDIRYPALLAMWGAVVRLIPWFGALIAVLPALFVAIGSSPILGIVAAISTVVVLFLLKEVIEPRVFHRHKYSSLLIVLFVIGLAEAFGFIGVILAPPLAVAVQIMFRELFPLPASQFSQEVSDRVSNIRKRLLQLRRRIQRRTNRKNRQLINRIYYLVRRTSDYLQGY